MKTSTINMKTETELKRRAEQFAKNTGMSLSDVVNLSLRETLNRGRIVVEEPLIPNVRTARELKQAVRDAKRGRNVSKAFSSTREMDEYLDRL